MPWMEALLLGKVPERSPDSPMDYADSVKLSYLQRHFGMWANVDLEWTKHAAEWIGSRKTLEVMSGRGWLASALRHHGVDLVATDDGSWDTGGKHVTEVLKRNATRAVKEFSDAEVLVMAWPPLGSMGAQVALKAWGRERPVLFVGEIRGCTGTEHMTRVMMRGWECRLRWGYRSWRGFHDDVFTGIPYEGASS